MDKRAGRHRIRQQMGADEVIAQVELEVELHDWEHDPQFSFPPERVACAAGAAFGAKYALDYARGYGFSDRSFRVDFKLVKGGAQGSAEPLVALASALAVFDALGIKPNRPPRFDGTNGISAFPL
jgi:hypothetical protein